MGEEDAALEGVGQREPGCPFCSDEARARAIAENGTTFAIEDEYPVTRGHVLVIPVRHVPDVFDMTDDELHDAAELIRQLRHRILEEDPSVAGFNVGANSGVEAGQSIMHAHIHLIPRREGDVRLPKGGVRGVVPEKQGY